MSKVISDKDEIRQIVKTYVEILHNFAEKHGLPNVEIRCEKILNKMKCYIDIKDLFLNSLKCDLYADILGFEYYPLVRCDFIPPSSSPGFHAANSIRLLDDHIFGGALSRKNTSRALDLSIPDTCRRILEKQTDENMNDLLKNMK